MFKHLLVPLDGSSLAEAVLPAAAAFARALRSSVTLLHVLEADAPAKVHRDRHLAGAEEAQAYLQSVRERFFPRGARIELHVHRAPVSAVARSLVEHSSSEFQPDLILLTSHGNSGMRDLFFGNIPQQVAAGSGIPVFLIKPGPAAESFHLRSILVPLDNESIHDLALPAAVQLARAFRARLDLLCVIPTPGTLAGEQAAVGNLLPTASRAYLEMAEEMAREHFQAHLEEFARLKLPATAEIARGDPAQVIAAAAERLPSDLILFGTHGRAGMEAFWNRSVAAAVARRTRLPLLLVPLHD